MKKRTSGLTEEKRNRIKKGERREPHPNFLLKFLLSVAKTKIPTGKRTFEKFFGNKTRWVEQGKIIDSLHLRSSL
ncbi:MAG: hypothetical protein WA705_12605 [Candidatus Ozemobacteraceae bacterium]